MPNAIRIRPMYKNGMSIGANASNKETGIPSCIAFLHGDIHSANGKANIVPPTIVSKRMIGISLKQSKALIMSNIVRQKIKKRHDGKSSHPLQDKFSLVITYIVLSSLPIPVSFLPVMKEVSTPPLSYSTTNVARNRMTDEVYIQR